MGRMPPFDAHGDDRPIGTPAPRRVPRRTGALAGAAFIAACSALALTGCAASSPDYAVLDREAQQADEVPGTLPDTVWDEVAPETSRFVGEHDGTSLWLTRSNDETAVCLLAYADEDAWMAGCSDGPLLEVSGAAGIFAVVPDGAPGPDGMGQVSDNVYAPDAD